MSTATAIIVAAAFITITLNMLFNPRWKRKS